MCHCLKNTSLESTEECAAIQSGNLCALIASSRTESETEVRLDKLSNESRSLIAHFCVGSAALGMLEGTATTDSERIQHVHLHF